MTKAAIREQELTDLAKDVMKCADNISKILNDFDNKFYDLESYYKGKSYNDLKFFYIRVRNQFPIVKNNILSYSDDFIALIRKMGEASVTLTKKINEFTDEVKKKNSTIDENYLKEH